MVNRYKKIQIVERFGSSLLIGSTIGISGWYLKSHQVDNYLISISSDIGMELSLLNIIIKKLDIKIIEKIWYIAISLQLISLITIKNPIVYLPLMTLLSSIDFILYGHIHSHYLNVFKEKINIRDLNADLSVYKGIAGLIAIPIAITLSKFYSDIMYILTIVSYITLDFIVIRMYKVLKEV